MQVVEQQHHLGAAGLVLGAEVLRHGMERAVADLLRIVGDAGDVRAGCVVEPDQVADQRGLLWRAVAEQGLQTLRELVAGQCLRVTVQNVEAPREEVAHQAIGHVVRVRLRAGMEERDGRPAGPRAALLCSLLALREPAVELEHEPALAETCVAHDRDLPERALVLERLERFGQTREFQVAPDHARLDALDPAVGHAERTRPGLQHEVAAHRLGDSLHHNGRLGHHVEGTAHVAVGVVADAQRTGRRRLLHARGHVDGDAANAAFGIDTAAEQHRPGVDAHAQAEAVQAEPRLDLRRQHRRLLDDRQARMHRTLGVVFTRLVGAEHRQKAVAGVLQYAAMLGLDHRRQPRERAVHHRVHVFRVELAAQRGGTDHVHEQNRDRLELLVAVAGAGSRGSQLLTQRGDGHLGHGVAEQSALRVQRGNGGL